MTRLSDERGMALVPALAAVVVVLLLGAAVLSTVDAQTSQTGESREQEGSFQVAESALNSGIQQLSRSWPQSAATAYGSCTQATAPSSRCMGSALTSNYTSAADGAGPNGGSDFATAPTWSFRVIDDAGGSSYYDDSLAAEPSAVAWDSNANGKVWVRSQASVDGRDTVVVSLVEQGQPQLETLPSATIVAGWFQTTNEGKKVIVDAHPPTSGTTGNVSIRCSTAMPSKTDPCLGYDPDKGQLNPADAYATGYVDGTGQPSATNRSALGEEALARLRATAINLGTYYGPGQCPSTLTSPTVNGQVAPVWVENANCSYTSNSQFNSAATPGVVIFGSGTLRISARTDFYGLIYMANGQGLAPDTGPCPPGPTPSEAYHNMVVDLGGTTTIHGSIMIDKCGGVFAGASGVNILFDPNVFANVKSTGIAAGVKNSFRVVASP